MTTIEPKIQIPLQLLMIGLLFEKISLHLSRNIAMPKHTTNGIHLEKARNQTNEEGSVLAVTQSSYSWPIPPASELEKYNNVLPWAADRILAMAEAQLVHRTKIEKSVIEGNINAQKTWVYSGFIIWMTAIIGWTICIIMWHDVSWVILGGSWLTWLVSVFVLGKREQSEERAEKRKTPPQSSK